MRQLWIPSDLPRHWLRYTSAYILWSCSSTDRLGRTASTFLLALGSHVPIDSWRETWGLNNNDDDGGESVSLPQTLTTPSGTTLGTGASLGDLVLLLCLPSQLMSGSILTLRPVVDYLAAQSERSSSSSWANIINNGPKRTSYHIP